jgi:Transposase DDE domain
MASIAHWKRRIKSNLLNDSLVSEALDPQRVEAYCREIGHRWRERVWSPGITLLAFLLQVFDPDKTLRAAVAQLITHLAARGQHKLPSADPSSYCQARQRTPGEVFTRVMIMLAENLRQRVRRSHGWLGRRVWVVDATNASMPDTPDLQSAFPQPSGQAPGCGFPVCKVLAVMCWASGAVREIVIDALKPHDLTLFRRAWHVFDAGDIVLADRAFCSFVDVARMLERGVHCVLRMHQRREADFRKGKRLGHDDRLITWSRSKRWLDSCGISREAFNRLPETIPLRMIRITGVPKGFRSRTIVVVTTFIDPVEVPADEVRALYRDRWMAELNFRSIKTQLGMEVLRGKSHDVVIKEILMHMIAYNLIRLAMWKAAQAYGGDLHRLSFTGTMQRLRYMMPLLMFASRHGVAAGRLQRCLLECVANDALPDRPNRLEPRRRKRRPKEYSLLQKPRQWYHSRVDHAAR